MSRDERPMPRSRGRLNSSAELEEFAAARRARRRSNRWKRPRRILGIWARLALLASLIVVLIFMAVGLVSKAVRPYREAGLQSRQLAETRQESGDLDRENAELAQHIAYLRTPEGIAAEARKMGYLRPGEIPIVVEGGAGPVLPADTSPLPSAAPRSATPADAARRFWQHLTGHWI